MNGLIERIKIFSIFWIVLNLYFAIPLFVDSISVPSWLSYPDQFIPFIYWMIIPYYFHYILVVIPPFIILDNKKIKALTSALIKSSIICYLFYVFWPISSDIVLNQIIDNPLSFLHSFITFDFLHQNAFPSMHITISFIIGLALIDEYPHYKRIIYCIVFGIFLATFLIKQHYLLDSIVGLLIGFIGNYYREKC